MRNKMLRSVLIFAGLILAGLFVMWPKSGLAANPTTISFQGKVVNSDGTNVTNGTYSFIFRIYNTSSPTMTTSCTSTATCLWQETQASVSVTNGIFQVELGSACALTSSSCNNTAGGPINFSSTSSLYLTLQFNGDTSGSNGGYMSPLMHLNSVPFAFQADNSSTVGGLAAGNFVQLAQGLQTDASTSNASIAINKTGGTANILTLQKSNTNVFTIGNTGAVTSSSNSATGFQVQDSSNSKNLFTVDTSGDQVVLGMQGASGVNGKIQLNTTNASNTYVALAAASTSSSFTLTLPTSLPGASNYCIVSTNLGALSFSACGASATATITLTPEYPGAVLTPANDGFTHTGTMTSDYCGNSGGSAVVEVNTSICASGQYHNYYSWTGNATNYYDIFIVWQVPTDFSSLSSVTFNGWTTTTSDSASLRIYKSATSCGSTGTVTTTAAWGTASPGFGSCTIAAGDKITFDVTLKVGVNNEFARAGEITIAYNRN